MHIGENQLLPHSISFSLLSTGHPRLFQQAPVRSSTPFHRGFNLPMDRSCGFGSISRNFPPSSDSVSLRLQSRRTLTSLLKITRRLILQKAHRHLPYPRGYFRLRLLVGTRVQVFSLPARGAFHLSLSVLFLYRSPAVFSLGPWSALFQPEFHVLRPTRVPRTESLSAFAYGAFTLCGVLSQYTSTSGSFFHFPRDLRTSPSRTHNSRAATTAVLTPHGFRLLPFRSPLLGESLRFLFLGLLRCFTSPGSSLVRG